MDIRSFLPNQEYTVTHLKNGHPHCLVILLSPSSLFPSPRPESVNNVNRRAARTSLCVQADFLDLRVTSHGVIKHACDSAPYSRFLLARPATLGIAYRFLGGLPTCTQRGGILAQDFFERICKCFMVTHHFLAKGTSSCEGSTVNGCTFPPTDCTESGNISGRVSKFSGDVMHPFYV